MKNRWGRVNFNLYQKMFHLLQVIIQYLKLDELMNTSKTLLYYLIILFYVTLIRIPRQILITY